MTESIMRWEAARNRDGRKGGVEEIQIVEGNCEEGGEGE